MISKHQLKDLTWYSGYVQGKEVERRKALWFEPYGWFLYFNKCGPGAYVILHHPADRSLPVYSIGFVPTAEA